MTANAVHDSVNCVLKAYSLTPPPEHVASLSDEIRWLRRQHHPRIVALGARQRKEAAAHARALCRHIDTPPRRPETTERRRLGLIDQLDSLPAVLQIAAAPDGLNITPIVARLKAKTYTAEDLSTLVAAIATIPARPGGGPPNALFRPLLVAGVHTWEVCGRTERYTMDRYADELMLVGPLPDFIRALIDLAGVDQPSDAALERHLRQVKNV